MISLLLVQQPSHRHLVPTQIVMAHSVLMEVMGQSVGIIVQPGESVAKDVYKRIKWMERRGRK